MTDTQIKPASQRIHKANVDRVLIGAATIFTLLWILWQAKLLYDSLALRVFHSPKQHFDYSALLGSTDTLFAFASFVGAVLALHIAFAWANLAAFQTLLATRIPKRRTRLLAFVSQLVLTSLALCLTNAWFYAESASGDLFSIVLIQSSGPTVALLLTTMVAIYYGAWAIFRLQESRAWRTGMASLCVVIAGSLGVHTMRANAAPDAKATAENPNIIVIGIDSLRPDHLQRSGAPFTVTPHLDMMLQKSVVFTDTLTTQAHTFPATTSILTGQWPTNSGGRGNLFPPSAINTQASMAHAFRRAGYHTIMAMDETRFSNIDENYGFDKIVGPRMGVVDFVMSLAGDNVLVNLVVNSRIGRWLFPAIHGNRAIDSVYSPDAFSGMVDDAITDRRAQPLFLYLHLCAGHWPYRGKSYYQDDSTEGLLSGAYADSNPNYLRALGQADEQLGHALQTLESQGLLDNAVVVALSDHGEDFNMAKDVIKDSIGQRPSGSVYGHGGSAYRAPQTQVLLAMRRYGGDPLLTGNIEAPASLVDIAPTIFELAELPAESLQFDGVSLASLARGIHHTAGNTNLGIDRIRYVESSFFPGTLNNKNIDAGAVVGEVSNMYEFTPEGRVQVRKEFIDYQISYRQRAAHSGQWAVATRDKDNTVMVIDTIRKRWWARDQAPPEAPIGTLFEALCSHWSDDRVLDKTCVRGSATDTVLFEGRSAH